VREFIKYYSLTIIFYLFEVALFHYLLKVWVYDIFWLNMLLRMILVAFFSIIVRNTIFKNSKFFYIKFLGLILINPLVASMLLKILTILYPISTIIFLKVISDLISSLITFIALKKIA
tara:strand:- start:9448 stop:9801 length:354 start_codon:yes stop_codon:yes gene_type:complete